MADLVNDAVNDEPVPTIVCDGVDIVYRVNGTGAGRGSACAVSAFWWLL